MDLRTTQLKDTYGNLVTTGTTAGAPTSGGLQNGQGTLLTAVGIGTNSPTEKLQINSGYIKVVDNAYDEYFLSKTRTDGSQLVGFQSHSLGALSIHSDATERMRIDSSGNVLVGTTDNSPVGNNVSGGIGLFPNGSAQLSRDGGIALLLNRKTSDGTIADFRKDGTTVGSIASVATGKVGFFGSGGSGAVIDSSGNVGIGTDNPDTILELDGGTSYEHLKISASGNTSRFMKIGMDSATEHTIEASGPQCFLTFKTGATPTEQVRIDSSGNVGIGQTNPSSHKLHVASSASFAPLAIFENTGSGQSLVQIKSPSASILEFGDNDDGNVGAIQYYHSDNTMRFKTNDSEKMRILSSGGITFNGDTADANALDDYEEGTWTPAWDFATSGSVAITVSSATYTKIGRMVSINARFFTTSVSSPVGDATLTGLPFTANSSIESVPVIIGQGYRWGNNINNFRAYINSSSYIQFVDNNYDSASTTSLVGADFDTGVGNKNVISISATYFV